MQNMVDNCKRTRASREGLSGFKARESLNAQVGFLRYSFELQVKRPGLIGWGFAPLRVISND